MAQSYFAGIPPIEFAGVKSKNPFPYHDKDRIVLGKRMEDHLGMAVSYWHTFCSEGADMFGPGTFHRPWNRGPMNHPHAELKLDVFRITHVRHCTELMQCLDGNLVLNGSKVWPVRVDSSPLICGLEEVLL